MPEGSGRKHRHHYLPVFHLREFADQSGNVWTHDRQGAIEPNPKALNPTAIAAVQDLYTIESHAGAKSDELENWLAAEIDGPASQIMPKLISGDALTQWERSRAATYIMSRDLRTPKARDFLLAIAQGKLDETWKSDMLDSATIRARILSDGGPEFTDEDIQYYSTIFTPQATPGFWLDFMMRHISGGSPRIFAKNWMTVRAPDGSSFLTTDIGILKHRGDFLKPVPHMIGWWNGAEGWVMPLCPTVALFMAPGLAYSDGLASAEYVTAINESMRAQADRFSFASTPDLVSDD